MWWQEPEFIHAVCRIGIGIIGMAIGCGLGMLVLNYFCSDRK